MVHANGRLVDPYAATWIVISGMGIVAVAGAALLGFSFDHESLVTAGTVAAVLVGVHFVYTWIKPNIYIGPLFGAGAVLYLCSILGGTLSLVALGTGAPLIDGTLAQLDASMGFDVRQFVEFLVPLPAAIFVLRICYGVIGSVITLTVLILVLTKRSDRLWEFCCGYAGSLAACVLISAFLPAIGAFVHYSLPRELLDRLPEGAGIYHLSHFVGFRSEGQRLINLFDFGGVISFPSFHSCMALLTAYAYRNFGRVVAAVASAFSSLVIIGCIPIGGHYVIDLIAGVAIWALFVAMTRTRAPMPAASAQVPAYSMIPKRPAQHLMRGGYRFPACAKPVARLVVWLDASAREGRSEKIMPRDDDCKRVTAL